jgi:hypothetical protein
MQYPGPRGATYLLTGLLALALAADLLWMPVQVSDSLGEILDARHSPSAWASFLDTFGTDAYLRPFRIAQIKLLYDAAGGTHYWLVYRGFHAVLIGAALFLFVRVLRVTTTADFVAAAFGTAVLVGLHTFRGTVREAFPINHFLEIVVACLLILNLARTRGGIWVDATAALVFVMAALTLESGLLVWVVAAAAWAVGWRGISTRGLVAMTLLLAGYAYLRFGYLSTGLPSVTERSSGFLLDVLERDELERRFAAQPLPFYAYNVATSALSVLFSEPQHGVFEAVSAWVRHRPMGRVLLPVISSLVTTGLVIWSVVHRLRGPRHLDDTGRLILVFAAVLGANAVLSFAYTKDEIMSVAGVFYALAAFGAARDVVQKGGRLPFASTAVCAVALCGLATAWSVQAAGVHYVLRSQAIKHQIDWVQLPGRWQRERQWPTDPGEERLVRQLWRDALRMKLPNTRVAPEWPDRVWTE